MSNLVIDDGPIGVVGQVPGIWADTDPVASNVIALYARLDAEKPAKGIVQVELRKFSDSSLLDRVNKNVTQDSGDVLIAEVLVDGAILTDYEDNGSTKELLKWKVKDAAKIFNLETFVAGNIQFLTLETKHGDLGTAEHVRDAGSVTLSGKGNKSVNFNKCSVPIV